MERDDHRPRGVDPDPGRLATVRRAVAEFLEDDLGDRAAALTYYGLLSLFPALLALVSLLGLFGDPGQTTRTLTGIATELGPASAARTFSGPIESITRHRDTAGVAFVLGLAAALWSASAYVGAFIRAAAIVYETPEGRPPWKLRPLQLGVTLAMIVMLVFLALGLATTGPVLDAVARPLGVGEVALGIWRIARWPAMGCVFLLMIAVLYWASPNVRPRGFRWVSPGSLAAIVVWVLATALFAIYAAELGSYDRTYGALGGVVALLVWLWLSNAAILFGLELDAEIERGREIEEGRPGAEREIQLEPRAEPEPPRTA